MAAVVDGCVGGLPVLLIVAGWISVIQGMLQAGVGALLYYGLPLALFTGMGAVWAFWMWRAHRGTLPLRSVGLVVAGIEYRDGRPSRSSLRGPVIRGIAIRVGAATMATLNVLVMAFALYQVALVVWSVVAS